MDKMDKKELADWFAEVDGKIMEQAKDWPACWGEQFRVSDLGQYVSEETMDAILPSKRELCLYYCMCAESEDSSAVPMADIVEHQDDMRWLGDTADSYTEWGNVFYTESWPADDYTHTELVEMASERPDLFEPFDVKSFPEVARAARDAGMDVRFNGERLWCCSEEGLPDVVSESELAAYFDSEPDLAQQKEAGTTFYDWVFDNERMGIFAPLFGFEKGAPVDDLMDGLSRPRVASVPFYDVSCGDWRQAVVDQEGREYAPLCDNLKKATWSETPAQRADRAAKASQRTTRDPLPQQGPKRAL